MNTSLNRALRALGSEITPAMVRDTMALYAPHARGPRSDCVIQRDLAYGPDARNRLDVFRLAHGASPLPMFVFVHGGGFVGGDKGAPDAPFYNNIGVWAARTGFVGITITYRLAPQAQWPAGADDVGMAVDWLRANADRVGGDAAQVFLVGHSAGATHVAGFLAAPQYSAQQKVAGAVLMSGIYDLTRLEFSQFEHAYFGSDAGKRAQQSPLTGLVASDVPCLCVVAEHDPPSFQQQTGHLIAATLQRRGVLPRLLYLPQHNHLSPALEIGSGQDTVGPAIALFMEEFSRRQA